VRPAGVPCVGRFGATERLAVGSCPQPSAFRVRESERAKDRSGSRQRLDSAVGPFGADCPVLLGLVASRITRCASFARSARTHAASQKWRRAGARGREPCGARRCICALPATRTVLCGTGGGAWIEYHRRCPSRQGEPAGGDFWGGEQRRPGRGATAGRASPSDSRHVSERSERQFAQRVMPRSPGPSSTAKSARSGDRPSMSPRRVAPGATRSVCRGQSGHP
jgi:hypothetical protein